MSLARMAIAAAVCSAAWAAGPAAAACSKAEASTAEKAIDRVVNWQQLHKAWQDYKQCDSEQSVADIYTDAILRLTVEWKNVPAFADSMKDAQYRAFVYAHLQSPAAKDDREAVYSRAKASCPKGLGDFCAGLADATMPAQAPPPAKEELLAPMPMGQPAPAKQ